MQQAELLSTNYLHVHRYNASTDVALVDADQKLSITYSRLCEEIGHASSFLSCDQKSLVFHFVTNTADAIILYLAAVGAGHAVALLDSRLSADKVDKLLELYKPEWVICPRETTHFCGQGGSVATDVSTYRSLNIYRRPGPPAAPISPELMVLLTTSGSTGSPKFVRLSQRNMESNAESIAQYLGIESDQKAIVSLPIHYSYGLSVVNSHLCAGARLVVTDKTLLEQSFWDIFGEHGCTSFAGVPYSYAILDRIGFAKKSYPALRYMTQAGGKLANAEIQKYHELMDGSGKQFIVMYGQTEAAPRISYLPSERLLQKLGSVGVPIPGGSVSIDAGDREIGEVIYRGPNVMLGYAGCRADLSRGDDLQGILGTGDMGYLDSDGDLYITGRSKRIGKAFGMRLNLDELEALVHPYGRAAVICGGGDKIAVFCEFETEDKYAAISKELARSLNTHWSAFEFRYIESLPVDSSGKINYRLLESNV